MLSLHHVWGLGSLRCENYDKGKFSLIKALRRVTSTDYWASFAQDHLQTDAIDMRKIKNISSVLDNSKSSWKPWTVYSFFCVANGSVLIIDSVGVASSQCYKYFYFFPFPFVFHKTCCSPFFRSPYFSASPGDLSAWNNVAVFWLDNFFALPLCG